MAANCGVGLCDEERFPFTGCIAAATQALRIDPPAIAEDPDLKDRGIYLYGTIVVRPDADCGVVVHELAHHRQFRDGGGPALSWEEWFEREVSARRIELIWRGE